MINTLNGQPPHQESPRAIGTMMDAAIIRCVNRPVLTGNVASTSLANASTEPAFTPSKDVDGFNQSGLIKIRPKIVNKHKLGISGLPK
jgi:hypothetical protein